MPVGFSFYLATGWFAIVCWAKVFSESKSKHWGDFGSNWRKGFSSCFIPPSPDWLHFLSDRGGAGEEAFSAITTATTTQSSCPATDWPTWLLHTHSQGVSPCWESQLPPMLASPTQRGLSIAWQCFFWLKRSTVNSLKMMSRPYHSWSFPITICSYSSFWKLTSC